MLTRLARPGRIGIGRTFASVDPPSGASGASGEPSGASPASLARLGPRSLRGGRPLDAWRRREKQATEEPVEVAVGDAEVGEHDIAEHDGRGTGHRQCRRGTPARRSETDRARSSGEHDRGTSRDDRGRSRRGRCRSGGAGHSLRRSPVRGRRRRTNDAFPWSRDEPRSRRRRAERASSSLRAFVQARYRL